MQDKTVPETTERQMCAAAAAGVHCSPRCPMTGLDPVDAVVLRHLAWDLDRATDAQLANRAARAQEQHRITGGAR